MQKQSVVNMLLLGLLVSSGVVSATPAYKIVGSLPAQVQLNTSQLAAAPRTVKPISLERVDLSPAAAAYLG